VFWPRVAQSPSDCAGTWTFSAHVVGAQPRSGCDPQPKVAVLSYLGRGSGDDRGNPNGVAAALHVEGNPLAGVRRQAFATTPLGLRDSGVVFPRVAEYSNPGLEDGSPSGNVQTPEPT
jgi:hypothetical protein